MRIFGRKKNKGREPQEGPWIPDEAELDALREDLRIALNDHYGSSLDKGEKGLEDFYDGGSDSGSTDPGEKDGA
jgi:hypothetical protein